MKTATQVIEDAFRKAAVYQVADDIPPEDYTAALVRLNGFLNSINSRGAVFPTVALGISDNVPVFDHQFEDLEWSLAKAMASQWGKILSVPNMIEARQAEARFIAQYTVVPAATPDAGLRVMPSDWRRYDTN